TGCATRFTGTATIAGRQIIGGTNAMKRLRRARGAFAIVIGGNGETIIGVGGAIGTNLGGCRGRERGASRRPISFLFVLFWRAEKRSTGRAGEFVGKDGFEAPHFVLIVQHDNGHHAELLFAKMTKSDFALQILQEPVRKPVQRTLAAGVFLVARTAVG